MAYTTPYELAEIDLAKAERSLVHAKMKPNVTVLEVENLEKLVVCRREILKMMTERKETSND